MDYKESHGMTMGLPGQNDGEGPIIITGETESFYAGEVKVVYPVKNRASGIGPDANHYFSTWGTCIMMLRLPA